MPNTRRQLRRPEIMEVHSSDSSNQENGRREMSREERRIF